MSSLSVLPQKIPLNKQVKGEDITKLMKCLKLSYDESIWLFGVSEKTWKKLVIDGRDTVIDNQTISMLAKYYSHFPEKIPVQNNVDFDKIRGIFKSPKLSYIASMLGKDRASAHRWSKGSNETSGLTPSVQRLANHLVDEVESGNIEWWENMVKIDTDIRGK
jgi:hypothetical protein